VEFSSPSECCRLPAARARSRPARLRDLTLPGTRDPPLVIAAPTNAYAGCPCRRDDAETPSRKARDAAPSPVPSSGFLPLSTDLAASRHVRAPGRSPPPSVTPPTLRGLVSCRSRPWNDPSELSPSGEPCPLSRAFASLRVRVSAAAGATCPRVRGRFPRRADPLPRLTREGSPDAGAGTTVPCFH